MKIVMAAVLAAFALVLPAATPAAAAGPPPHLVIIMMENHGLKAVTSDTADMPYLNSLWNGGGKRFTRYYGVTHPSWPNYSAMFSGVPNGTSNTVRAGEFTSPVLWDQLTGAAVSWGVYEEAMPSSCYRGASYNDTAATNGQYVIGHNPGVPFASVYTSAECQHVLPLSALNLAALPRVSFIAPNLCDDMHGVTAAQAATYGYANCVTGSSALEQRSDSWLNREVSVLTRAGATVLITFDEGAGTAGPNGTTGGGQVYAVLTGAGVTAGTSWSTPTSHYGVLRAIEDAYGLPELANASTVPAIPLR